MEILYSFILKVKRKLWYETVKYFKGTKCYYFIYRSYLHYIFFNRKANKNQNCYFSAYPNPGAGIGHQIANWNAGYWFAKEFNLKFAHIPFSTNFWERLLGFGLSEVSLNELKILGYKTRKIPLFAEDKPEEIEKIRNIIASYRRKKVVFLCEQDQSYKDQYGVINDIQRKFYAAESRQDDNLIFEKDKFNVAIHVRRGDIVVGENKKNPNLLMRWQNDDYFLNVLYNVLNIIKSKKLIKIYLFSQGKEEDFKDFKNIPNLQLCLDMGAHDSFLHMVYADLLITSKSSFSYKPALLSKGIKVCPQNFWHGYPPNRKDWILADDNGNLLNNK